MKTCNTMKTGKHAFPSRTLRALGTTAAATLLALCAALAAAIIAGTLSSCEHKGFCDPDPAVSRVRVTFDWRRAPGASATGMSLYLYPDGGVEALRYDFDNAAGGVVEIPPGTYKALFLNNDTENVLFRGTGGYGTFEAYTRPSHLLEPLGLQSSPADANPTGEAVVLPADPLWAGRDNAVEVLAAKASPNSAYDQELTFFPERETCYYTVEVVGVQNLKYASGLGFSLSGLSGSLMVAGGARPPLRSTLPFEARGDGVASAITGAFHTFGLPSSSNKARTLSLYVILTDGSKQFYTFDVAAQVNGAEDPKRVHIVINGLTLPKPIVEEGGGFLPTVDDWAGENVEVEM